MGIKAHPIKIKVLIMSIEFPITVSKVSYPKKLGYDRTVTGGRCGDFVRIAPLKMNTTGKLIWVFY